MSPQFPLPTVEDNPASTQRGVLETGHNNADPFQYPNFNPQTPNSLSKDYIRSGFIRKVYGILSLQILITAVFIIWSMNSTAYKEFLVRNIGLLVISAIGTIVIILVLACCQSTARKVPLNYILLFTFTILESYLV